LHGLEPPGLSSDGQAETLRNEIIEPTAEAGKDPKNNNAPQEILAEEETEVREPSRAKKPLPGPGRKDDLKRSKDENEEPEADAGGPCKRPHIHGDSPKKLFGRKDFDPLMKVGFGRAVGEFGSCEVPAVLDFSAVGLLSESVEVALVPL